MTKRSKSTANRGIRHIPHLRAAAAPCTDAMVLAAKVLTLELKQAAGVPDDSPEYWRLQRRLTTLLEVSR